jgi:hypothetical protein
MKAIRRERDWMSNKEVYRDVEYDLPEMVEKALDGSDQDYGELETIKAEIRNAHRAIGWLLDKLPHVETAQEFFTKFGPKDVRIER